MTYQRPSHLGTRAGVPLRWAASIVLCALLLVASAHPAQGAGVVGSGTPGSCTEAALDVALAGGADNVRTIQEPSEGALGAVTVSETFKNDIAPGWLLLGSATLTSGVDDPIGDGWLRLTSLAQEQAGSAVYNTPLRTVDRIVTQFQYATYGGDLPGDGFAFYLIDGATAVPTLGLPGGNVGYVRVTNGYVGIGFDEYGNFSFGGPGDCIPSCPGLMPNSITVRGSGSLDHGFNYLTQVSMPIATGDRDGAKTVRITWEQEKITVEVDAGSGFVTYLDEFDLRTAVGQRPAPYSVKVGFSGATGQYSNYHEIRNVTAISSPGLCGNGAVDPSEECDDANLNPSDGCTPACTKCGNEITTSPEQCDDGNRIDGDDCEADCTLPACGNRILDRGEQCDDGNLANGDGCDANCTPTGCGNGIVTPPEACDDGNRVDDDGCNSDCRVPACGDGVVDLNEECDDGNRDPSDGCTNDCTICGNGIVTPPEACDGNFDDPEACTADCRLAVFEVGSGTPASCTESALDTALVAGRTLTFNCGTAPVKIIIAARKIIDQDTIIDGGRLVTISGDFAVGVFAVNPGVMFTVENLSITDGSAEMSPYAGGAIFNNRGTLTVINCTLADNGADYGGGILNDSGTLTVANCTFSENIAGSGGSIYNYYGTVTVSNSTFFLNSAYVGGNIENYYGAVTIANSTIADNSEAGIVNIAGALTIGNTLLASMLDDAGCINDQGQVIDRGDNLIADAGNSCDLVDGVNGNIVGVDPLLDPDGLKNNGGPTQTIALLPDSPAIDAGDSEVCANPPVNGLDQRGYVRPGVGHTVCSIGAYEADAIPVSACLGDCDGDGTVAVNELILGVDIALGVQPVGTCPAFANPDGMVGIAQLIAGVNNALDGCGTG